MRYKTRLTPGCLSGEHFCKLISVSTIHSDKVIMALEDFCVYGHDRKSVCARHNVSQGYFSISLRKLQKLNQAVADMLPFYIKG